METQSQPSAAERTFGTSELLECILMFLPCHLLPHTDLEDPRSRRIYVNAMVLRTLLRCTEVNRTWHNCIYGSKKLQRALFLVPDYSPTRCWERTGRMTISYLTSRIPRAPQLNPIIQNGFSAYQYRFWNLNWDTRYCAYMILHRDWVLALDKRVRKDQGRNISNMQLSAPPCHALEAMVWDERAEWREHIGKTTALQEPVIRDENGVTLGMVHARVRKMFEGHKDVTAIKLTTM